MCKPRRIVGTAAVAVSVALGVPASAQDQGARVEEIVVTAQKREQRWIDVPINLTALSGEFLQDLGYYDYGQIGTLVPGLTVQSQSPNNPGYNIRGITSDDGSAQFEPRVSLYENGVPTSRNRGSYAEVFDAERIEVLKGPQSTLFGRSAEIGAISVVTNKPTDEVEARLRLGGGNLGYFLADGSVNVPIGPGMATRLAVIHRQRNGFQENFAGGDLNGLGVTAVRGSMRFWPTDDLTMDVILGYQHDDTPGTGFKTRMLPTIGSTTNPFDPADLEQGRVLGIKRDLYSALGQAEWRPDDDWSVTSSTSWRQFFANEAFDADGSASPSLFFREIAQGVQFNQELRANYEAFEGAMNGFFGVDFFYEDGSQNVPLVIDDATVVPVGTLPPAQVPGALYDPVGGFVQNGHSTFYQFTNFGRTYEFDLFTDATYTILEGLELTAGVRGIFLWKRSQFVSPDAVSEPGTSCPGLGTLPCSELFALGGLTTGGERLSRSDDFGKAVGRAILHYDFNEVFDVDASVFGGWNRGWRPPVIQVDSDGSEIVPGETVDSYEVGGKGLFFDGMLQLEGSFYYYDYQNFQITFFNREAVTPDQQGSLSFLTINGGNATGYGTELALNSQPLEWLNFFTNFAWTHARFDDDVFIPTGTGGDRNLKGSQFRLTPEYKVNVGGQVYHDVASNVGAYVTTWFTWQSEIFFENTNDPTLRQPSYGLWNMRVGADLTDVGLGSGRLGMALFAYNLLDKRFLIDGGNTGNQFGLPTFVAGPPRLWGGEVTYSF